MSLNKYIQYLGLMLIVVSTCAGLRGAEVFGLIGNKNVNIDGFGFFGDITLTRSLDILEPQDEKLETFDSIFVEDALWILSGELKRRGYLYPAIEARLTQNGQVVWEGRWDENGIIPALKPRLQGDNVHFEVIPGILFYFDTISMEGLPDEVQEEPAQFFYSTDRLIITEETRFYSKARLANGLDSIDLALRDLGYRDAKSSGEVISENRETGAIDIAVSVVSGPAYDVEVLKVEAAEGTEPLEVDSEMAENQRLIPSWLQRTTQKLRNRYYAEGHPQVRVEPQIDVVRDEGNAVYVNVTLKVEPGPVVRIGKVNFNNMSQTDRALLEKQAGIQEGALLNRTEVEKGRDNLSRLGIFRSLRIDYEDNGNGQWDVAYEAVMKKQSIVNLIFGVGSFDIVRGGFEVLQSNIWGRAHESKFSAIQSVRATYIDYTYTIPQVFGEDYDFFLSANYLRREEITFEREEYGGSTGIQHYFKSINTAASVQYNYGLVEARNAEFAVPPGPEKSLISSVTFKANRNELDNPVFPTNGWQVFGTSELAFRELGGQVEFQRIEVGGAWHKPVTENGLVFHAGYKTGVVTSFGPSSENIPVPKRFFMGGENTVRGYRRDQASPLNAQGQQIGAVSYMLWQVEFEQRLTELFSVVAFVDTVGNAANIQDYPFNQVLMSVGGGISIRTVVGPLRLEYGHNVKKRPSDPSGTFQVALGFPF